MGFLPYLSNEMYKVIKNWKRILCSITLTVVIFSSISCIAQKNWDCILGLNADDFYLRYFGPILCHLAGLAFVNLLLNIFYEFKFGAIEEFRSIRNWPWEKDPISWNKLYRRTFYNYLINQCLVLPIHAFIFLSLREAFKTSTNELPGLEELFTQLIFFHFCKDVFLYFEHIVIHKEQFYFLHKVHHEYTDVIGISSEYFHPVEYFFILTANIFGPILLGGKTHIFTVCIWYMTSVYDNVLQNYSGYNFPLRPQGILPFSNEPNYHYYHQQQKNKGAFSFYYNFFDRFLGLDSDYNVDMRKLKEM